MKNKVLALLVLSCMTIGCLAGCGGEKKDEQKVPDTSTESQVEETTETQTAPETETTTEEATEEATEETTTEQPSTQQPSTQQPSTEQPSTPPDPLAKYKFTDEVFSAYARNDLTIYSLPDESGTVVGQVAKGKIVQVTGRCITNAWFRVKTGSGDVQGYIKPYTLTSINPLADDSLNNGVKAKPHEDFYYSELGTCILDGWVKEADGIYYDRAIMPGGARYDAEFHAQWDGKTKADFEKAHEAEHLTINGSTPTGGIHALDKDYVIGSFAVYEYTERKTGEVIKFAAVY